MKSIQIILGFLQLHCFHVFSIRVHGNMIDAATTGLPNVTTTTVTNISVADISALNTEQNSTEIDGIEKHIPHSIKEEWPSKKPKPDLIVIKKKKLIPKHTSNSFSTDKIHFPHPNIGTNNDESKESKNFLPSPELSEDSSHASVTHDTYPGSELSENNLSNFVPSINPLIATQPYQPAVAGVQQKYHSHVGKLPIWPYPYENIDSKYKWKISSNDHKHKGNGKLLLPTDETTVSGNSAIYLEHPSKINPPATNIYHQPFVYDVPIPQIPSLPTPFSYTTIETGDVQTTDIEPTPDNRLPPWMEMLHFKNNEYGAVKAPIEYYAKAIENQPSQPLINHAPHYGLAYTDKNVLWHSVFKFLATAVPIGLVISALSPNVVTVNADSPPRLNGTFSRMNNTMGYPNLMALASFLVRPTDDEC